MSASSLLGLKQPIPTAMVQLSDSDSFTVRGLNPTDVFSLYYLHAGELGGLFDQMMSAARGETGLAIEDTLVMALVQSAPRIAAELIVLGTGGKTTDAEWETLVDTVSQWSIGVQADSLMKIAELTFTSDMPPGKFLALVAGRAKAVTGLVQAAPQP